MKKLTIAILAIAITAAGAVIIFGQTGGQDGKGERRFSHRGKMHKRGMMGARMFRHLDLTDAQKEQMKAIGQASRETTKGLRENMRNVRKQLRDLGTDGTFDQAAVETLAAQQAEIHKQLIIERQKVKAQMFAILTPEQKARFAEMKTQMADRMKERMEKRKARFGENKTDQ
ncbi:MAG: Spy/CpxP family protein refolding chaperone [Acidobacteriota bacterium]|nr:MAG: Spy/CpxP family protein refolding chaperone [Acidobacteriota bacterium]